MAKTFPTMMDAWRAASAEYKATGETLITDQNESGKWIIRPQTEAELKQSQEDLVGLWNAELDRHTPANGGRS